MALSTVTHDKNHTLFQKHSYNLIHHTIDGSFQKPILPYSPDALEPHMSEETLNYHWGKHHLGYIQQLNEKIPHNNSLKYATLETLIAHSDKSISRLASQAWSHSFFWNCMSPKPGMHPFGHLKTALENQFGQIDVFKEKFFDIGTTLFGSGWVWLAADHEGQLILKGYPNAKHPLNSGLKLLLCCDVWEHAYYLDHRNDREQYLESFWNIINWDYSNQLYLSG